MSLSHRRLSAHRHSGREDKPEICHHLASPVAYGSAGTGRPSRKNLRRDVITCTHLHNPAPKSALPGFIGGQSARRATSATKNRKNRRTCHLAASPKAVRFANHDIPRTEITKNRQTCHQPTVSSFVFIRVHSWPDRFIHTFSPRRRLTRGSPCQAPLPYVPKAQNFAPSVTSKPVLGSSLRHPSRLASRKSRKIDAPVTPNRPTLHNQAQSGPTLFVSSPMPQPSGIVYPRPHPSRPVSKNSPHLSRCHPSPPQQCHFYRRSSALIGGRNDFFTPSHSKPPNLAQLCTIPPNEFSQRPTVLTALTVTPSPLPRSNGVFIRIHSCSFVAGSIYSHLLTAPLCHLTPPIRAVHPAPPSSPSSRIR
jgi:hypothetical protein